MAAVTMLAVAAGLVALASPASATNFDSNVTLYASAGSAPAGYAYPNATITFTGDVDPSNVNYNRQVRLMRWVPSTGVWVAATGYQATTSPGGFTFTDQIPRNEPYARWNVQVTQRTAGGGNIWYAATSPTLTITQTAGSESLSAFTTVSPKIAQPGVGASTLPTSYAGQLARLSFVGGGAARTINLQERNVATWGDSYWHDLPESRPVAAFETGTWQPRSGFANGSEYRAIYHYTTGVDTYSPTYTPVNVIPEFADEFSGTTLSSKWAQRGARSGQAYEVHSMDPAVVNVSGGAVHLKPRVAPVDTCTHTQTVAGVEVPLAAGARVCMETPHITTEEKYVPDVNGDGLDNDGTTFAPPSSTGDVWLATRAKVQAGPCSGPCPDYRGSHSSFWWNNGYCDGGETDVMEYFGDGRNSNGKVQHNVYWSDGVDCDTSPNAIHKEELASEYSLGSSPWSAGYHIYAVRVRQGDTSTSAPTYTFYIDGVEITSQTASANPAQSHLGIINNLILSNIVRDTENVGAGTLGAGSASSFDVDWVQVWRMPAA
jgi:hypothetical protein